MENATMGKVSVAARLENLDDLFSVRKGQLTEEQVRHVDVTDALIDTGATGLLAPSRLIAELGLEPVRLGAQAIGLPARPRAQAAGLPATHARRNGIGSRHTQSGRG